MNLCYCGHPAERHKVMLSHMRMEYEYGKGKCTNCSCSEYALDEQANQGASEENERIKLFPVTFNGEEPNKPEEDTKKNCYCPSSSSGEWKSHSPSCPNHPGYSDRTEDCDFPKECKHGSTGRCEECLGKNISQAVLEERKRISDEVEKMVFDDIPDEAPKVKDQSSLDEATSYFRAKGSNDAVKFILDEVLSVINSK